MKRDTVSGLALIVGSVGTLVTMALHPSPGSIEALVRQRTIVIGTHSLALISIPVIVLGFLGLYQRLKADYVHAPAAIVTYAFGAGAVMCAAVINGLVAPMYAAHYAADPSGEVTLRAILNYNGHLNQAFALVFMTATSVATMFWSIAILRTGAFERWVGILGVLVGLAALVGMIGGVFDTTVHGFGLFILGTSAWVILIGVLMCRSPLGQAT